jgi:hypothetical protein
MGRTSGAKKRQVGVFMTTAGGNGAELVDAPKHAAS